MATRFRFPSTTPADVVPADNGAWFYTDEAGNYRLEFTKTGTSLVIGTMIGPWLGSAGNEALDRRYVSPPLAAQTIDGTVKMQLSCCEEFGSDNVTSHLEIYVVSNDGSVVRGTLLALGNAGPDTELINSLAPNIHRNKSFADGDALTPLAIEAGDRLVVAVGYGLVGGGTGATPEAEAVWGDPIGGTDLGEDETQQGDVFTPWIEFSADIAEYVEPDPEPPAPEPVPSNSSHVAEGLALLLHQFKGKANIEALLTTFLEQVQNIEDALQQLLTQRSIADGAGAQLDGIGRIVDRARDGLNDATYRERLSVEVLIHKSSGTVPHLVEIFELLLDSTFTLEEGTGGFVLTITDPVTNGPRLAVILQRAKAAGVRALLVWRDAGAGPYFAFGPDPPPDGAGFDEGAFAAASE